MPTKLEPLNLIELSLVDKGANKDAKITIFKRADDARLEALEKRIARVRGRVKALAFGIEKNNPNHGSF